MPKKRTRLNERGPTERTRYRFPEAGGAPEPRDDRRRPKAAPRTSRAAPEEPPRAQPGVRTQTRPMLPPAPLTDTMRIAKAMARAGLCSRRDAERWIADGRVAVNGETLKSPAKDVGPRDRIEVDGQLLPGVETTKLWRFHKERGCVTTHRDPEGRPTVFEKLPSDLPRVISIGRLDFNTEGLLLLTNDGELARHLELPATGWMRRYRVRAFGNVTQAKLDVLKDGLEIEGVRYGPIEATLDQVQGANVWLTIGLREGKNREVRNILASLELTVNRLIRISFGPFQLFDLEPGVVEGVKRRVLSDQLGPELTEKFGLEPEEEKPRGKQRAPRPRKK
jgi:23S rRNA pseudouridine2605 synthase